jgi:signal transduction histidine kinase
MQPLASPLLQASWSASALWVGGIALAGYLFYWAWRQVFNRPGHNKAQQAQIRSSIAGNLHDELGWLLMRIHMQVESLLHQPPDEETRLERLLDTTRAACSAMRDVAWGLDASADTLDALQDRMRDLLDQLALNTPLRISFTMEGLEDVVELPAELRQEIYLVFKEATTNVLRHAQGATSLTIRLYRQKNNIVLEIKDNGAPTEIASRSGMGLRSMKQRAQVVKGKFEAGPRTDGSGFRVSFCAPLAPLPASSWLARWLT